MLANRYIQRRVADADSKACFVCYRPTTSVMVNEVPSADYFFACDSHLNDPGFATLDKETDLEMKRRELKLKEIEALKAQWEEVQKKKSKNKEKDKDKEDSSADARISGDTPPSLSETDMKPIKKVYELHKGVFNLRIGSKRRAAQEKKTKTMLETPGLFPQVPTHKPN